MTALNGVYADILWSKEAAELRETWPCRLLAYVDKYAEGHDRAVAIHVLMLEFPKSIETLARVAIPGRFIDAQPPFLHDYASVTPGGRIVCQVSYDGRQRFLMVLYRTKDEMISVFRRIADKLKLKDTDRVAMFTILGKFISCDLGIDVHGERKVS